MKKTSVVVSIIMIAAFALAACSPATALSNLTGQLNKVQALAQASTPTAVPTLAPVAPVTGNSASSGAIAALESNLEQVYSQVSPSVVNIQVTSSGTSSQLNPNSPFGFGGQNNQPQVSQALGSGFVWDNQGDIVTNNHVVEGAINIQVTFSDDFTVPAKVVGTDPNSDLAVVKVEAGDGRLHPITLADSTNVKVGQMAIAIGNPFGLSGTMTEGIISAVGRSLPSSATTAGGGTYTIPNIIQTDAPINPGNSGGVLLNAQGQVIGVTSAIESNANSNSGIGFAIPSAIVNKVVPVLIQKGSYTYSWLGLSGTTLTFDLNTAMKLKSDQRGVLVVDITAGSPAEKAGLKGSSSQATLNGQNVPVGGDVITAIDGQPVNTFEDMVGYLIMNTQVGQKVTLTVLRNGSQQQVDVTLAARPGASAQSASPSVTSVPGQANAGVYLGIMALDLSPALNQAAGLPNNQQGILVQQVQSGSPASLAGLKGGSSQATLNGQTILTGGDVITAIDGQALTSVQDLQNILQQDTPGQQVTLSVLRNGQATQLKVTLAERPAANQP